MRLLPILCCLSLFSLPLQANDVVLISGGPALRSFEKYKRASHDKYWGNFIDSALTRTEELKKDLKAGDKIVWLVFRPSYTRRTSEDQTDYLKIIEDRGAKLGLSPTYFDNKTQLFTLLIS